MLADGLAHLAEVLTTQASQQVTYRRGVDLLGTGTPPTVNATIGQTVLETDDGSGAIDRFEVKDFLIKPADLTLNGVPVEPERGDEIDHAGITYLVDAPPGNEHFQHDGFRSLWQVHTWKRRAE